MPTQPSMIEGQSLMELRCKVHEREMMSAKKAEMDGPTWSLYEGGRKRKSNRSLPIDRYECTRWVSGIIGTLFLLTGTIWSLTILGLIIPWLIVLPFGLALTGILLITSAILQVRWYLPRTNYDRCDH